MTFSAFFDGADERDHRLDVGQAHILAGTLHRQAFEPETGLVAVVIVARSTAKTDHRIFLDRLKFLAADEHRVFVRLKIGHTHDHRFWIKCRRDTADPLGQTSDKELFRVFLENSVGDGLDVARVS